MHPQRFTDTLQLTGIYRVVCLALPDADWQVVEFRRAPYIGLPLFIAVQLGDFYSFKGTGGDLQGLMADDLEAVFLELAAIGDIRLLFRKTFSAQQRLARHLWRMCLGFFIAAGSAFTGPGAAVFPQAVQDSGILSAPELIIFCLMLYWFFKTLYRRSRSKA